MLSKTILIGNLGQDPDIRFLPSGEQVVTISLATTRKLKNKEGKKIEETTWHRVVFWGGLAKVAADYTKQGSQVYIEGRIKTGKYEKDGVEHKTFEIVAEELRLLGGKQQTSQPSNSEQEEETDTHF